MAVGYKTGDGLLSVKPFVHCVLEKFKGVLCDYCFKEVKLSRCSGCKLMHYCNLHCQKSDWNLHKTECKKFASLKPSVISDDFIRLCIRVLIRLNNGDLEFKDVNGLKTFNTLMDHYEDILNDSSRLKQIYNCLSVIKAAMGDDFVREFEAKQLISYLGKIIINTFTISSYDLAETLGSGIYLSASTLNHSCEPNCVVIYDGVELIVKVLKEFQNFCQVIRPRACPVSHKRENSTIVISSKATISYTNLLSDKIERQGDLLKQYYFKCNCNRCSCDTNHLDDKMVNVYCSTCHRPLTTTDALREAATGNEDTTTIELTCSNGDHSNVFDLNEVTKCLNEAKRFISSDTGRNLNEIPCFIAKFNKLLSISEQDPLENVYAIRLSEILMDFYINTSGFSDAVSVARRLIHAYGLYYPANHPLIAVNYLKIGKLHLYNREYSDARDYLSKANGIIQAIYPKSHLLLGQSMELLQQCAFELNSLNRSKYLK